MPSDAHDPDPIAEADAELARAAPIETKAPLTKSAAVALPAQLTSPVAAKPSPRLVQSVARARAPLPALSYSLPPKGAAATPNPMDAIRAQVASQLSAARPAGAVSPAASAPLGGAQPGSSVPALKPSAKPVNRPSLFPVSDVNQ